jgi:two-component system, chemotaxis family, chemotaxis protein CheY
MEDIGGGMAYKTVMIVDDSPTSQMIIQKCVQMTGLVVDRFLFAENGIDALALIDENPETDLIFSDINMPKMDGQTFVRLLKNKDSTSSIPVIITSSIADGSVETEMKKLGVSSIIKKPVSPEKVVTALGGMS